MLGADTRATAGTIVAEKSCSKIHYIAPNMYCCGAGTAAGIFHNCNSKSRLGDNNLRRGLQTELCFEGKLVIYLKMLRYV